MIKIELTTEQANNLLQLIDIAIKAGGFQNAKVGVPLADLILEAAKQSQAGPLYTSDAADDLTREDYWVCVGG